MRLKITLACAIGGIFAFAADASACSCIKQSLAEKTARADLIVSGTVKSSIAFGDQRLITIIPQEVIKGAVAEKIQIFTADNSAACGYAVEAGETHLIFAWLKNGKLHTTLCDGSTQNPKPTDLKALRGLTKNEQPAVPTPLPGEKEFPDLASAHPSYAAVQYLAGKGLISGYEDGSVRPDKTISRAAFAKIAIGSVFSAEEIAACQSKSPETASFPDVPVSEWYAPYACLGKAKGSIGGYPDGSFKPGKEIAFAAVAKILAEAYGIEKPDPGGQWYEQYVRALARQNAIPQSIKTVQHKMTRAEVAEIIWRLENTITDRPSAEAEAIIALSQSCRELERQTVAHVDMERVRAAWLAWHNAARAERGLPAYTENAQLILSADRWSEISAKRGYMDHKREGQSAYYDYGIITGWFQNLGLKFANKSRITYSESIGWGPWRCAKADCTDEMIAKVRQTYDFYYREGPGGAHFNAIVSPGFTELGMAVRVNASSGKYFITTHYGTEVISDPQPICE